MTNVLSFPTLRKANRREAEVRGVKNNLGVSFHCEQESPSQCCICVYAGPVSSVSNENFACETAVPRVFLMAWDAGKVEDEGHVENVFAEMDTGSWLICASEPLTVRVALAECCSMHSVSLTDLLGTVITSEDCALDLEEFVQFMVTRCGHQGGRAVLNKIFYDLDEDGSGLCSFEELNRWMRNTRRTRQERLDIVRTLKLTPRVRESESAWDAARLRSEIQSMLLASGCRTADLCEAWDETRKGVLSRTALLRKIKCLVEDEELWNSRVRAAAKAVLACFDSNEIGISLEVVWHWLLPRAPRTIALGKDAARQAAHDRRGLQHSLIGARLGGTRSAPVLSDRPTRQTREHRAPPAGPARHPDAGGAESSNQGKAHLDDGPPPAQRS